MEQLLTLKYLSRNGASMCAAKRLLAYPLILYKQTGSSCTRPSECSQPNAEGTVVLLLYALVSRTAPR